jgi:small subunit ribosomal protein S20
MPNTPTARAELRKSLKRREVNRSRRSAMHTAIKNTLKAVEAKDAAAAAASLRTAAQLIDKNVKWKQLHANNAARKKSRLARAVGALKAAK